MDLAILQARVRIHRVRLKVQGGRLLIAPLDALPDDLRALIAAHRDEIMIDVQLNPDPVPGCCLCGVLLPPGRIYLCAKCQVPRSGGYASHKRNAAEFSRVDALLIKSEGDRAMTHPLTTLKAGELVRINLKGRNRSGTARTCGLPHPIAAHKATAQTRGDRSAHNRAGDRVSSRPARR